MQVLAFSLSHCRVRELHQWRPQPQGRKKEERATAAVLRRKGSREGKNQAETKKRFDLLRARPLALHSHNGKPARRVQSARPIVEIKSSTLLQGSSEKGPRRVQARGRAIPYLAFAFFGERVVKARERERLQRKKILSTSTCFFFLRSLYKEKKSSRPLLHRSQPLSQERKKFRHKELKSETETKKGTAHARSP